MRVRPFHFSRRNSLIPGGRLYPLWVVPFILAGFVISGCAHAQPQYLSYEFDGPGNEDWDALSGNWRFIDGVYRQGRASGLAVTTLPYTFEDLDLRTEIDIEFTGGPDAFAGFRFFAVHDPDSTEGYGLALSAGGPVLTFKDGDVIGSSDPIPNPLDPHTLYWEYVGPKSIARLDSYPDVNGWDCDAKLRKGLVHLVTYNCAATFDYVTINNRGPLEAPPGPEPDLPPLSERSFYCPAATTGAGGSLLKFWTAGALTDRISHFAQIPNLLDDARKFGSNTVYLVDWWDGGYSNKGDYVINQELGGEEAFRSGIRELHAKGGKIVLYLEPFIIHKNSEIAQASGEAWAMMNSQGEYYPYYGLTQYYLMYPGEGSGWTEYFSDICGNLARDYEIDGVFLDSYGIQWDWKDYNPAHPNADTGLGFDRGVENLIDQVRRKMDDYVSNPVIWLEGSEQEHLLQVVDGSQIESLAVYKSKPWWYRFDYQVYIAEYDVRAMLDVLEAGASLACNDFYFADIPSDRDFRKLREGVEHKGGRDLQQRMWKMVNVAYANGIPVPGGIDPAMIDCDIEIVQFQVPDGEKRVIPDLVRMVDYYEPLLIPLRSRPHRLPADLIRDWLTAGDGGTSMKLR
jgi:hypothetical protein